MISFWFYFNGLSTRIIRINILSLETGASLPYFRFSLTEKLDVEYINLKRRSLSDCVSSLADIDIYFSQILDLDELTKLLINGLQRNM